MRLTPEVVMIEGQNVICFSNIDWGFMRHRHHHLMKRLAKHNRVLFIETFGMRTPNPRDAARLAKKLRRLVESARKGPVRIDTNLYIYSPVVLPFYNNRVAHFFNRLWLERALDRYFKELNLVDAVVWVYLPTRLVVEQALRIKSKLLVYDCCDNVPAFPHAPKDIRETEIKIAKEANIVLAASKGLFEKVKALNSNSYLIRNAAEVDHFARARDNLPPPQDMKNIPQPRIGFMGAIYEWMDQDLVCRIARERPKWSIVLVGPSKVDVSKLEAVSNIYLLGDKSYADLPNYLRAFDVCVIPFSLSELTTDTNPVKAYEYLSAGKPVVSTPLPEMDQFKDVVYIADTCADFIKQIQNGLNETNDSQLVKLRMKSVANETWDIRFQSVTDLLSQELRQSG